MSFNKMYRLPNLGRTFQYSVVDMYNIVAIILYFIKASNIETVSIDPIDCGIDHEFEVSKGDVEITTYPFLGILYYCYDDDLTEGRAVTPVALIQDEFCVAAAADIGVMPKTNFRANSRVLLGETWEAPGRRVRNYVLHPEYGETMNTLALIQLKDKVRYGPIKILCPPPDILRNPEFYVMRFKDDYQDLKKEVIPVSHVPGSMCKDFYVTANLYAKKMRPPHVVCAVSLETTKVCVWEAGGILVARDVWGRWQLLGFGVRGPGCGAPSRFLDMMSYYPWIHGSLQKFRYISITEVNPHKYVLRSDGGFHAYQRFGDCDPEEKKRLLYRDSIVLRTDNRQYQFMTYNMTIYQNVLITCLTLELVNASAVSEMMVKHLCPRKSWGPACHVYQSTVFDISVHMIFSDKCLFEMFVWGRETNLTLIDIMEWKWEEATYYEDFSSTRVEYRGTTLDTLFGYEPLDESVWVPEYDQWYKNERDWSSTTPSTSTLIIWGWAEDGETTTRTRGTWKTKHTPASLIGPFEKLTYPNYPFWWSGQYRRPINASKDEWGEPAP